MLNFKFTPLLLLVILLSSFIFSCKDSSIDESYSINEMIKFEKSFNGLSKRLPKSSQIIVSSRVEDECIDNNGPNCVTYINLPLNHLYLPEYDCFVSASASIIMCHSSNTHGGIDIRIYFKNFYIYYDNETDCAAIKQYWALLKSQHKIIELDESISYFNDYVADIYLNKFLNDFFKPQLGMYFECNSINNSMYVNYVKKLCYKFCVKDILIGGVPSLEVDNSTRICGMTCCKRTSKYCLNNGNFEISEPEFTQIGSCSGEAFTTCPDEYTQIEIDCHHGCF